MKVTVKKYLKTTALAWAACFILFGCLYMMLLAPQISEKNKIQKELDEKQTIFNSALQASRKDTKIRMKNEIGDLRSNLGRFVIDTEDLANLIFDISQMAKDKQVRSFSIESKDEKSSSRVPNCQLLGHNRIDLSFTSDFKLFATMLNSLERNKPFVFVDKFSIRQSNSQAQTTPDVRMNLSVFVKEEQDS
jgi:methionine synthase II (cobalamin-independent)